MHDRIYYYKYFDQAQNAMMGVNVYEIDPERFPAEAPHHGRTRALGAGAQRVGISERPELGHGRQAATTA